MKIRWTIWGSILVITIISITTLTFAAGGGVQIPTDAKILPIPLSEYQDQSLGSIGAILSHRIAQEPFNLIATLIFALAILHTFVASKLNAIAHRWHHEHEHLLEQQGKSKEYIQANPSFKAEIMHFVGEIEAIFGIWVIVLVVAMTANFGFSSVTAYLSQVNYTEPMFIVVIMTLASTGPVIRLAEQILNKVADLGKRTPAASWLSVLTLAPILGSFITEPAAMTIAALLLAKQFYELKPSVRFQYATIGLLFVNISVGGTLTHFAAPPVLMVAAPWGWDINFMFFNYGWKAVIGIVICNLLYYLAFKNDFAKLQPINSKNTTQEEEKTIPAWVTIVHLLFMGWTVFNAHYPVLFIGGFLLFMGFAQASKAYQEPISIKAPLLVGFFLAGLVTHGGLQSWWIAPILGSLPDLPLMIGSIALTAFNDNAAITFLATLVPDLSDTAKYAVVAGAVTGGGLTVIANAPNPAGQAILSKYFAGGVSPAGLAAGAIIPTIIFAVLFKII